MRAEAELLEIDGRVYRFRVAAYDNAGLIAEGKHERVSVKAERFVEKAARTRTEVLSYCRMGEILPVTSISTKQGERPHGPIYDVVLFDFDGTFCETGPGVMRSVAYAAERMGLPALEEETLRTSSALRLGSSFRKYFIFLMKKPRRRSPFTGNGTPKRECMNSLFTTAWSRWLASCGRRR